MLTSDVGGLFLVALLAVAVAVQMEPGRVGSTLEKQVLAVNSSVRKSQLGLGPASIAGTWNVTYDRWDGSLYHDVVIDCFGRYSQWDDWTGPMFFASTQINAKCIYGDQAGAIEWVIPGWIDSARYECGWWDGANDVLYSYHYSAASGGADTFGHSNVGFYGRMEGTRTSTAVCPAGLKMFLYAPHWTVVESHGFKPDGVDPISGDSWDLDLVSPVITFSGTQVFDLTGGTLDTDETSSWTLGNHFTECAWVEWRDLGGSGWRTLMRTDYDHVILVENPTGYLGLYKNQGSPTQFQSTGYVINDQEWNFVCIVVDADTPSSSFYVSVGGGALTHIATLNTFAGSGQQANTIGWSGQGPGYVYMFAHWEAELSVQELQRVMADTAPPMVTVPTPSPIMAPTASPTASPTTASPTSSPTASPTTAAPVAPPAVVGAVGDPHMSDVRGRAFDMNAVGTVTLLLVPKGAAADLNSKLLRVQASTKRAGLCGGLYIQNLLVHGKWVQRGGGYNISATNKEWAEPTNPHHKWRATVGPGIRLTVGYGTTESGILYLNFHAYGLANARIPIGGLLGDEDNEAYGWAKEKPKECLSLTASAAGAAGSEGSTASASL